MSWTARSAKAALCALGVGLLGVSTSPTPAHEGATGVVKQRMDDMKSIGRALKRINERSGSKRGSGPIGDHAEEIRAAAARMPSLFPTGSLGGHSEVSAAVWDRWPEFVAAAKNLEGEAEKLVTQARSGSDAALAAQVRSTTRACSGCHDVFRSRR